MSDLSAANKHLCNSVLVFLAEKALSKTLLQAHIKLLDKARFDENEQATPSAEAEAIAAYLVIGIEEKIPEDLRLRARHILFGSGNDEVDDQLGKTGILYSYADALNTPTQTDWVIENLFAPASISLLCGEGGTKKTYAMIDLAIAVARGSEAWLDFKIPEPLVCLFVDEESGPRRFAERLKRVGPAHDANPDLPLYYISLAGFNLTEFEGQDKLHKLINETRAKLVILDALVDVMGGGDENAVSDVQPIFVGLRRIAEMTGAAILIIHHNNRTGSYRGSSALKGAVDIMLMVSNDSNVVKFSTEKARDIEPITFYALANFANGQFNLSPTPSAFKTDTVQPMILTWLNESDELNQSELVELGRGCNIGRNSILKALDYMVRTEQISVVTGKYNEKSYSILAV